MEKNVIVAAIESLNCEEIERLAKECGFQQRTPKKITPLELLNLYCLESMNKAPSFNDIAGSINDSTGNAPSRQAVAKRINENFVKFLRMVLEHAINHRVNLRDLEVESNNTCFPRILVQDSTIVKLPSRLFNEFSGVSNGSSTVCGG